MPALAVKEGLFVLKSKVLTAVIREWALAMHASRIATMEKIIGKVKKNSVKTPKFAGTVDENSSC